MPITRDNGQVITPNKTQQHLEGLGQFEEREIRWSWNFLQMFNLYFLGPNSSITQKKEIIINHINNLPDKEVHIRNLKINIENYLIPLQYLEWIGKNENRKIIWLIHKIQNEFNLIPTIGINGDPFKDFIYHLDIIPLDVNHKISFIQTKKIEWLNIKTLDKEIKWLDSTNNIQLTWALEYLIKFYRNINIFYPPQNNIDLYNAILISLDNMSYGVPSDKKLFLDRMKKTWSQKKFRDSGKAKKPYHLPLTKTTQKQLEKLAELKNCRKEQIIEQLIEKEFVLLNLDENGKPKYK
ncbi:hypothetical protein [Acinetobacter junii]|uniref:hypothetical protein n=1 Tax=Acinetobacter junii TaxID=40215 RepID=UPI0030B22357